MLLAEAGWCWPIPGTQVGSPLLMASPKRSIQQMDYSEPFNCSLARSKKSNLFIGRQASQPGWRSAPWGGPVGLFSKCRSANWGKLPHRVRERSAIARMRTKNWPLLLLILLAVLFALYWVRQPLPDLFGFISDRQAFIQYINSYGILGPVVLALLHVVQVVISI